MSKINLNTYKLNETLNSGGVISFVTDTVWGIGCLPDKKKGIDKIYEIKGRDRSKPLILMSNNIEHLIPYIKSTTPVINELTEKYFPGALTIVTEKSVKTPDFCTSGKNTVGIRVPDNEFFKTLCESIEGHVLATTSANLSGMPSAKTYEEARQFVGNLVDTVFEDFGYTCKGRESTVISVINDNPVILRQGDINPYNLPS